MARTRWGESASAKVKVNLPCESVFAWLTSSMPAASLMRMTSSPADGLLVVPLVTVPLRLAANKDDGIARSRNSTTARDRVLTVKSFSPSRAELLLPESLRTLIARSRPESQRLLLRVTLSSPDNQLLGACPL